MQLKKITATSVFDGQTMLPVGTVVLLGADDKIVDIVPLEQAGDDVLQLQGTLSPGFVNTHCHIELSHLKGKVARQSGLVGFIENIMQGRHADDEEIKDAMQKAAERMRQKGIVAVGDICNGSNSVALKQQSKLYWHSFIEVAGFVPAAAEQRFAQMQAIEKEFGAAGLITSFAPHAPYSVSGKLFELIAHVTVGKTTSIHNQECAAENEWYQYKTGDFAAFYEKLGIDVTAFKPTQKTSLQSFVQQLQNCDKILAVHNTFTSEDDLEFLKASNLLEKIWFCFCPKANLYIENCLPPIDMLRAHTSNITIGTDSLASNDELCIASEMRAIKKHFPEIELAEMLRWATFNGAKALGIEDRFGRLTIGKSPGLVLLDDAIEKVSTLLD